MKVVLISYHYYESKLRAGFHHLADAYWELGWEVVFVTAPLSPLSRLVRDPRLRDPVIAEANRPKAVRERLTSYVLYSRVHPANLRLDALNRLTGRWLVDIYRRSRLGALEPELASADVILFESTPALVLVPNVRRLAGQARLVYRVSDDLEALRVHPAVLEAELEALPLFDYVSSPSRYLARKLGALREVTYEQHAVNKHLFDAVKPSPYGGGVNVVWVGKILLDPTFLDAASARFPDWTFHIIGPALPSTRCSNVVWHGETRVQTHGSLHPARRRRVGPFGDDRGTYRATPRRQQRGVSCSTPIAASPWSDRPSLRTDRRHSSTTSSGTLTASKSRTPCCPSPLENDPSSRRRSRSA